MDETVPTKSAATPEWQPVLVYGVVLLALAITSVVFAAPGDGLLSGPYGAGTAVFFLVLGLFSIGTGFPHPAFGHVSFDRVAQVASILVLGPVDAAWVNGLASFMFPWHRLLKGVPLPAVATAAFHNAGLMIIVVLGCGLLYQYLGGQIPVEQLDWGVIGLLLLLVVAMQVVNDLGMMFVQYLRGGQPWSVFNRFTVVVEFISAAAGVVLAIAFVQQSLAYFSLLLAVLGAGMLVIMQYALMRYRLEGIVEERTRELRDQALEFERQATHDKLTGLPNRRYADDYLQQQIDRALRSQHGGAVALGDIDYFKRINDEFSHAIGDQVLERIAQILSAGCRKSDFVARYGGEEFLICFPETDLGHAGEVCGQLRQDIEEANWDDIAPDLGVTISFGLAGITDGARRRTVLNDADARLYRAKREGRNRVVAV
ncbi:MAG: GGDEF domain-containing protein [Woeseiaceae bacterium]|jgi:diguanylate cyclase (GGDEF)-like protein